jgi:CubicO group peptidase (beta-lactamase class C family)
VELEAFVDGLVRDAMQADHIAGVTVSIVQGGQIVLSKGYGFADFSPVRRVDPNQTLFRLGSVSKTFTWIALMQQVEAGRVRLDAPINTYLPDELDVPRGGRDREIRVRDLMTHTPGFDDPTLGHLFVKDADRIRPLAEYLRRERPRRVREPGELPTYSNYGVGLAGAALAELTGRPFEEIIETRIAGPLGMGRTSFREPYPAREGLPAPLSPALASQISEGFFWSGGRFEERPFEHIHQIAPAGAASSTATDMARYMLAILNGGAARGSGHLSAPPRPTPSGPCSASARASTAGRMASWSTSCPAASEATATAAATVSFFSNMVTVPDLGLGVFIATNTSTGRPLVERAPAMIVQRF